MDNALDTLRYFIVLGVNQDGGQMTPVMTEELNGAFEQLNERLERLERKVDPPRDR